MESVFFFPSSSSLSLSFFFFFLRAEDVVAQRREHQNFFSRDRVASFFSPSSSFSPRDGQRRYVHVDERSEKRRSVSTWMRRVIGGQRFYFSFSLHREGPEPEAGQRSPSLVV